MSAPSNADRSQEPDTSLHHGELNGDSYNRRSWLNIFSPSAVAKLPKAPWNLPDRSTRTDHIPENEDDDMDQHRDYNSINKVRVPKKVATPIRVEPKVWFANERTWLSYVNVAILLGTMALALYNGSKDEIARNFAYIYAVISVGVLAYGWWVYQQRITMIRKRDPGHFNQIAGPVIISALLFFAVFANFIIRVQELRKKSVPIPPNND